MVNVIAGNLVDVKKLLNQLERSEKARGEAESKLAETAKSLSDVKDANERHTSVKEKLQVNQQLK